MELYLYLLDLKGEKNGVLHIVLRLAIVVVSQSLELRFIEELPADLSRRSNSSQKGLSFIMLCFSSISCWSLPSHFLEHWWSPYDARMFGKYSMADGNSSQKRMALLMAAALFKGASIGPLIELAIDFDPSIVIGAFVGCAVAFGCFSAAAMVARRREYLYLGGLLSSGLSILFWLHFASSIFGGSMALFKFEVYFGLLVFVGYIVVDTQDIIEKAHFGDLDYVKHALTLFTDFVAVFVRILVIMLKNASDKEEKKRKRRN